MQGSLRLNIKKNPTLLPVRMVKDWNKGPLNKYLHGGGLDMDKRMI